MLNCKSNVVLGNEVLSIWLHQEVRASTSNNKLKERSSLQPDVPAVVYT